MKFRPSAGRCGSNRGHGYRSGAGGCWSGSELRLVEQRKELRDGDDLDAVGAQMGDEVKIALDVVIARDDELGFTEDGGFQNYIVFWITTYVQCVGKNHHCSVDIDIL